MTVTVKVQHVAGNKAVEVVDQSGRVHATLEASGRSVEVTLHDSLQVTVREVGESHVTPGKASHDDAKKSGSRSGFPQEDTPLPSGAGEPGSSVPDVRIPDAATAPSPSSDDVPADRQAQQEAVRTRNSPTSRS